MATNQELLDRFRVLYRGNPRSFGRYFPGNGEVITEKAEHFDKHFVLHLKGEVGLGLVPILDDGTCWFAVIDIDCHGEEDPEIDLAALTAKIDELKLPLVAIRSKSGGAHVTLFGSEPLSAAQARQALTVCAAKLGHPGVEIFPKQARLTLASGEKLLGNWINLPYFTSRTTDRYALGPNGPLDLEGFITLAESRRVTQVQLRELLGEDHSEAPPCFQRMVAEGVPDGFRNEALYHATLYLKRAFPDDWRERAHTFNEQTILTPLPMAEAKRSITSASRKDYKYKCSQEPCKSLCNRSVCLTRKFGITPNFIKNDPGSPQMPEVTAVRMYATEPARFELECDGVVVSVMEEEFLHWNRLRFKLMAALHRNLPDMKQDDFERVFLSGFWAIVELMTVPEEATPQGLLRTRLFEWLRRAAKPDPTGNRQALLNHQPVKCEIAREEVFAFFAVDFIDHLHRIRAEVPRGNLLHQALNAAGMTHKKVRVNGQPREVWTLPVAAATDPALDPKDFSTEF